MESYSIKQALEILENGHFHEVAYVSANRNKNEGGKVVRINECRINPNSEHNKTNTYVNAFPTVAFERKQHTNHKEYATRNLMLANGEIRKMHIHLLFSINKIPVI